MARGRPLCHKFPSLFNICVNPSLWVAMAIAEGCHFRRTLGPSGTLQWHELNTIITSTVLGADHDEIVWTLDPSGRFSVKSMYAFLAQGATSPHHRDLWEAKLPLKIKVFAWQLAMDKLPSALQIASRFGPSDGKCALCGAWENAAHIFFKCSLAQFAWSTLRESLGRDWRPANFVQLRAILLSLSGRDRRLFWVLFLAQSWALWLVRNKLAIEKKLIRHPADILFKTLLFLQLWLLALKSKDQEGARWIIDEIGRAHV